MADLRLSSTGGVARVVLDRPSVLNALSPGLLSDLIEVCVDLGNSDSVKLVVFQGSGSCFSAGADVPAFLAALQGPDAHRVADLGRQATNAVAELPQITVAGIRGHCVGGALVLAAACDIRIAGDDVRFAIPELEAGIPLAWGGMAHLVRLVGATLAGDLVLSCRPFGAEEALRAGLISRVVPADRLQAELDALAADIERKPLSVLRTTKQQLLDIRAGTFDARKDADALLAALKDPEALNAGQRYLAERLRKG